MKFNTQNNYFCCDMGITIKPFAALRPDKNLAKKVACKPYDVLSSEEARNEAANNPFSFYYVDKSEISLPINIDIHSREVYLKAAENLKKMMADGIMIQEEKPCFYLYRLTMNGRTQTGLVANSSAEDYFNDKIKKHEFTRPVKEQDRINHMYFTQSHASPVFLCYKNNAEIDKYLSEFTQNETLYNFTADDGIKHEIWKIDQDNAIETIKTFFETKIECSYIADGHHRAASSAKVSLKMREENPSHNGNENYNFFLSVLFPDNQLEIMDYNRVIRDWNGLDEVSLFEKLNEDFVVEKIGKNAYKPEQKHQFGLYCKDIWYKLSAKQHTYNDNHPIECLDVEILSKYVLDKCFAIKDQRVDDRVDFVGGIRGLGELEKRVNSGESKIAVSLFPVSLQQLMDIADSGNVMPPKSTWFEPKLRSGLLVHLF